MLKPKHFYYLKMMKDQQVHKDNQRNPVSSLQCHTFSGILLFYRWGYPCLASVSPPPGSPAPTHTYKFKRFGVSAFPDKKFPVEAVPYLRQDNYYIDNPIYLQKANTSVKYAKSDTE